MTLIRVAVAGAAGRMGRPSCAAVEGAEDMELAGAADPALGVGLADVLGDADVVVDFTRPDTALANALACVAAGVHVVIGTTGFDAGAVAASWRRRPGERLRRPELRDRRGADDALRRRGLPAHGQGRDRRAAPRRASSTRPSGTAARTAELMEGDVPIHSVRLPGLVAHQEVILGDVGQTLTIRHDSIDRESFMPGVLLAVRRVGSLTESPVVGLEHLL